jgi:MOSC domain-containing protein YiiM
LGGIESQAVKPKVISVNTSVEKGTRKVSVPCVLLKPDFGVEGDAHSGSWHRQISLLAVESINKMRDSGAEVGPGDFAENITTEGVDLASLPVGTRLRLGETLVEVTQIGKECHGGCEIRKLVGDCVMPREGIFARVLKGGRISPGQGIQVLDKEGEEQNEGSNSHG